MIPQALRDDNVHDKMPIYLKMLPRPAQKFFLRYLTSPVLLVVGILVFLVLIPLLLQDRIDLASNGINNILILDPRYKELIYNLPKNRWFDLTVQYRREKLNQFTPYKTINKTKCIDRENYLFEFSRLAHLDPYKDDLSQPHTLVVGDKTDVGKSLISQLKNRNIPVAHFGCQNSIDFSTYEAQKILEHVNISRAIVTCPMDFPKYSTTDGLQSVKKSYGIYIRGLFRYFQFRKIPFILAIPDPVEGEHETVSTMFEGKIVKFPLLMGPDSLVSHTMKECAISGKSRIEIRGNVSFCELTADQVADYLIENNKIPMRTHIIGSMSLSPQEILERINKENPKCNVTIVDSPHSSNKSPLTYTKVTLSGSQDEITKSLQQTDSSDTENPYLSIVVVGRHDNFSNGFETRTQNFINSIGKGLERHPLANIELVFVDYATPSDQTPLSSTFIFPDTLKDRTRFINIPVERHLQLQKKLNSTLSFFEYIVKNAGIRRAKGKFVLSTNPDNIFPSTFFQLVEQEDFNEGVFYRSIRWDTRDHTFDDITIDDLYQAMGEPWRLKSFDVKQRCHQGSSRFLISDSSQRFLDQAYPCGGGDFIMLSKEMWEASWGFDEVPANPNVDAVFLAKFMKMIPGYARMFLHPINMHQKHEKKNVMRKAVNDHDVVMAEYACNGESKSLGKIYDNYKWGFAGEEFEEVRI
ncbi:hypothetical protein TRFO_12866 [Tritrichomonas foetus]|uniref:Uncharacterized protein n=1 Tax=Tritrichomonas foetus TaxID=1144522 RepID=A0A1J4L141_9EUKA|nr:hypothetical protein TRFO_12866 [Tritrichomonas foetus]|eukprot:OHT16800.1 hypothetical protein TRFO_12866 [Tritrichomonas foetus]